MRRTIHPPADQYGPPVPSIPSTTTPPRNDLTIPPSVDVNGPRLALIFGGTALVGVILVAITWTPKEDPVHSGAPGSSATGTAAYQPVPTEGTIPPPPSAVEKKAPSKEPKRTGSKKRRAPGPTAEIPPLEDVLQDAGAAHGPDGKPDPQLEEALDQIARGEWPQDEWTRRKAMLAVIFALRPEMKLQNWPNTQTPLSQLQSVLLQNLQSLKYTDIAKKLAAEPPVPVPSATR